MAKRKTEQEKITAWVEKVAKAYNSVRNLKDYSEDVCFCESYRGNEVHIYSGLEYIAEMLGIELIYTDRHDDDYPFEVSFVYKGVKFFQLNTSMERKIV